MNVAIPIYLTIGILYAALLFRYLPLVQDIRRRFGDQNTMLMLIPAVLLWPLGVVEFVVAMFVRSVRLLGTFVRCAWYVAVASLNVTRRPSRATNSEVAELVTCTVPRRETNMAMPEMTVGQTVWLVETITRKSDGAYVGATLRRCRVISFDEHTAVVVSAWYDDTGSGNKNENIGDLISLRFVARGECWLTKEEAERVFKGLGHHAEPSAADGVSNGQA